MSSWQVVLLEPARTVLAQIGSFMVNVLLVLIIMILGWIISKVIKAVVTKALKTIRIDEISERIELDNLLAKGGINYSLSELVGVICYWLSILVTFMVAINAVGLTIAASLLNRILLYVPNIIGAIFILVLGMFVATLLKNIVQAASNNAGISQGKLLSKIVEGIVIAFAVFIALEQLHVGIRITQLTVSIVLGSIGLGLALAFGLGCKDLVAKVVEDWIGKTKK
jgi:hypothetical protein